MIKSKAIRIFLALLLFCAAGWTGFQVYQHYSKEASSVKSIHVNLHTETKMVYGKSEFDVTSFRQIDKLLSFIKDYRASETIYDHQKDEKDYYKYEITVNYKKGNRATYRILEQFIPKDNKLEEVLADEDVVKEIRSFYTVEEKKVKSAELCKWSGNATNDVTRLPVTNPATVENLYGICKKYTLSEPQDSATVKNSELYFYDKKGKVLAAFYFSKDSKCYKELEKAVPNIVNFI